MFACFAAIKESRELTKEPVEITEGRTLHIGAELTTEQKQQLMDMIHKKSGAFTWDYLDMRGIHLDTCIHHIYTNEEMRPVR